MKKTIDSLLRAYDFEHYEMLSFILLILWSLSPVMVFIFQGDSSFWERLIYIIGILGILEYILYYYKQKRINKMAIKTPFPIKIIIALLIIAFISSIFGQNPVLSFFGEIERKEGLIVYLMYFGIILCSSFIKQRKYIKYVAITIIISAVFISLIPLFYRDFTFIDFTNIYFNRNHYGYFLMIATMMTIFMFIDSNKKKRYLYSLIYIYLLYILIRNDTFGCYLAIAITLIVLLIYVLIKRKKRLIVCFSILLFLLVSFTVSHYDIKIGEKVHFESPKGIVLNNIYSLFDDTKVLIKGESGNKTFDRIGTGRGILWKEAVNYTLEHPLIGGGVECLKDYYLKKGINYSNRPHNIILQVSSFIGIPGAILYIVLIGYLAIMCLRKINLDSMYMMVYFTSICYFISSMFGNSMFYTSPYFMILIGLLIRINDN